MIAVKDLTVTFRNGGRSIHAVRGVSFDVAAGETFGIVGESGSGKSTVLKAIAGLVASSRNAVEIDGRAAAMRRSREDRRLMQFVFQDPYASLHPRQTVDDILREPLVIHGIARIDEKVKAAIADVGLSPLHRFRYYADRYGLADGDYPRASDFASRTISLPLFPGLTEADQEDVIVAMRAALSRGSL